MNKTSTVQGELVPASNSKNVKHNREIALQMIMHIKRLKRNLNEYENSKRKEIARIGD